MTDTTKTGTAAGTTEGAAGSTSTDQAAATKTGEQTGTGGSTTDQKTGDGQKTGEGQKTGDGQQQQQQTDQGGKPESKAGSIAQPKAPEKYQLQVPDGAKAHVDEGFLSRVEKTAREGDLSNDEAQAFLEDTIAHVTIQANSWADETRAHPTYGGDKLPETQRLAKAAIDRVFPAGHAMRASFDSFLSRGGAGNNINVVAFLAEVGRLMGEDKPAHGRTSGSVGTSPQDKAAVLYDHPDSKALDGRA